MIVGSEDSRRRLAGHAREWGVSIERIVETSNSLIAYGWCNGDEVALKVVKRQGDEWNSGEVLRALRGDAVVCVRATEPGAVMMDRLTPGTSLVELVLRGDDERATEIFGNVLAAMPLVAPDSQVPSVESWGDAFEWYLGSGDTNIPAALIGDARDVYLKLCRSQTSRRLLHGDLQHSNVLFDASRGWTIIDPKGVVGEMEFELGAMLRNPREAPAVFTDLETIERRLEILCDRLGLDQARATGWAFAQSVLSAIWSVQDGEPFEPDDASLIFARVIRPSLRL